MTSSPAVTTGLKIHVSDCPVPHVYNHSACKLAFGSYADLDCLSSSSTSAFVMNIVNNHVSTTPSVAVQQVMNTDAALNSVIIFETKSTKSHFHMFCFLKGHQCAVKVAAMVDSGATLLLIDQKYANSHKMLKEPLEHPIQFYNINGLLNKASSITHKVGLILKVGQNKEKFDFYVASLGPERDILGLPWLRHRNPSIDWQKGTMSLNTDLGMGPEPFEAEMTKIMANCM